MELAWTSLEGVCRALSITNIQVFDDIQAPLGGSDGKEGHIRIRIARSSIGQYG
jgi:hypothetical protein